MLKGGGKSDSDIIEECMGAVHYMYFQFLDKFSKEPENIEQLIDGIIYIELNAHFEQRSIAATRS